LDAFRAPSSRGMHRYRSSGPHQMNIGWREVRTSRTVTRRLCGHVSGEPSDVFDQSNPLVKAPISPPPAKKSLTTSPPIRATSLRCSCKSYFAGFNLGGDIQLVICAAASLSRADRSSIARSFPGGSLRAVSRAFREASSRRSSRVSACLTRFLLMVGCSFIDLPSVS
jgi:hypothetical protein